MKKAKKLLSIILSVIILLSILPVTVNAAVVTYKCGDNLIWTLDTATGTLTISGEGAMANFTTNSQPWENYEYFIKNVVIESGVTTVGEHAFYDYDELRTVNIKNGSIIIEKKAFSACNNLTSVTIGDNTQSDSGGIIREHAFEHSNLSTVMIGNGMEIIERSAFSYCDDLINITLPKSVREFSYSYIWIRPTINYCGTSAEWDVFLNNNYTNSYLLNQCPVICQDKTIYPHGLCGEKLTWEIDLSTNSLIISGSGAMWDYDDFTDNESPWYCSRPWFKEIDKITIGEGVGTIGNYAFYCCSKVQKIVIPDSVTAIGEGAFKYCTNLTEITIPNSITTIKNHTFTGCPNLKEIILSDKVKRIEEDAFPVLSTIYYTGTKEQWRNLEKENDYCFTSYHRTYCSDGELLPSGPCGDDLTWSFDSVTGTLNVFGTGDMYDCLTVNGYIRYFHRPWYKFTDYIENVDIVGSVTSIGAGAFYHHENLKSITIPEKVTTIKQQTFENCSSLSSIIIPDSVITIEESAFYACDTLKTVTIGDEINSIGDYAFYDCGNISNVYYTGSENQWDAISIERGNTAIKKAKKHFDCQKIDVSPTCTEHGCIQYICSCCGVYYNDYTANPTGHTLNEDGVCEICGEKETTTNHVNPQMLTMESVLAMVMNLLAKIFGVFSVA